MSWIPVPPIATSDKNLAPTPSFSYPPPTATFGSSPPAATRQPHWPLSYGPKEEIFPENKTPHLQPILDKYQNQIFIGKFLARLVPNKNRQKEAEPALFS